MYSENKVFMPAGTPLCSTKGCNRFALRAELKKVNQQRSMMIPRCIQHLDLSKAAPIEHFSAHVARLRADARFANDQARFAKGLEERRMAEATIDRILELAMR